MEYESASVRERRTIPPAVAVSTVAFALRPPEDAKLGAGRETGRTGDSVGIAAEGIDRVVTLWIPLVRRTREPYRGLWALPGGPTRWNETLSDTALRTLRDAVRRDPGYLEQLYAFGGIERSADAQRLVTIAYWALYGERELAAAPTASPASGPDAAAAGPRSHKTARPAPRRWDDVEPADPEPRLQEATSREAASENVAWFSADGLPELAFDHAEIIAHALARLRTKTEYSELAHRFLGTEFTLGQLRSVYDAVTGKRADPANFRRQMLARRTLVETGAYETGTRHRPARLYRFRGSDAAPEEHTDVSA